MLVLKNNKVWLLLLLLPLLTILVLFWFQDNSFQQAKIKRVIDGDTIDCEFKGNTLRIRLIGIDAPESVSPEEDLNCTEGHYSSQYLSNLLKPKDTVYLEKDVSDEDKYGRSLRYVWLEKPQGTPSKDEVRSKMVNAILVEQGIARAKRYPPDTKYSEIFEELQHVALENAQGVSYLWAT